jgi:hypothetical protein
MSWDMAEYRRRLQENDPVKYTCVQMRCSAQKRAKKQGLEFDITTDFLIEIAPKTCPVFHEPLEYGGGQKTKMSASLDRIDSTKGYTRDNVQIISSLANSMKSNATVKEMIFFAHWVGTDFATKAG